MFSYSQIYVSAEVMGSFRLRPRVKGLSRHDTPSEVD